MSWPRRLGMAAGLLGGLPGAHAAWIHVCPAADVARGAPAVVFSNPGGGLWRAFVSEEQAPAPGCRSAELPVAAVDVLALKPVSPALAARPGDQLTVTAVVKDGKITIGSIEGAANPPSPPSPPTATRNVVMPFRENLLAAAKLRVFGAEERAHISRSGPGIVLQCEPGVKPAGLHLSGPWHLPQAEISVRIAGTGAGSFTVQMADEASKVTGSGVPLGVLNAAAMAGAAAWTVPRNGLDRLQWEGLTIACPNDKTELQIESVMLVPGRGTPGTRSTWVWSPDAWQAHPERVLKLASQYGIKLLFVSVPVAKGAVAEPTALAGFIRRASRLGVSVWAVDGDPQMILPDEHAPTVARVQAYRGYNDGVDADARLRGVQFDIEPYLLPEYESAPQQWDLRLVELAKRLQAAAGPLAFELVVPFWWAEQKTELLQRLAPSVTGLTVMDYRTDPTEILRFAVPFLDWGTVHRKQVRIALEAGPVDAETQWRYTRSDAGQLWIMPVGTTPLAVLLNKPYRSPAGVSFRLAATTVHDGSATTFHRDPQRLLQVLPELEADFSAWESFAGVALHEVR